MKMNGSTVVGGVVTGTAQTICNDYEARIKNYIPEDKTVELQKYDNALKQAKNSLTNILTK